MPPIRRYWFVYLIAIALLVGLAVGFHYIWTQDDLGAADRNRALLLLGGLAVAGLTIFANAWSQWRTAAVAHAMDALQTLRTDREYLINVNVVMRHVRVLGRPLSMPLAQEYNRKHRPSTVDAPSFRNASLFVLNQYEFLAAGVRSGAIDYTLVETTLRGPFIGLVKTYAVQINEGRRTNPRLFDNLLWLYRRFRATPPFNGGPIP